MAFAGAHQRLAFSKFEGLGNDFLVIDLRPLGDDVDSALASVQAQAPKLCDRRFGVGGDGLLLVLATSNARHHAKMVVINADGSRPEMCGNGLRCVAHYLSGGLPFGQDNPLWVETDNGPLCCVVTPAQAPEVMVRVAMGPARIEGQTHPTATPQRSFLSVNMGNPHAISWVGESEDPEQLARIWGASIETDVAYPAKTNVEFVLDTPDALVCWVWERGCGITLACGTGACATAVAAVHANKRAPDTPIAVQLPGGTLKITVPKDPSASVSMLGPSRWVFDGSINCP